MRQIWRMNAHSASPKEKEISIRIINHLKLIFFAERPSPPQSAYQEVLMAAEGGGEYSSEPFFSQFVRSVKELP